MKRVSKSFYIATPIVAVVLAVVLVSGRFRASVQRGEVPPIMFFVMVPYLAVMSTLLYKAWAAIQDGHARTSPGRAVGFLFIPLFNVYWLFQVIWGFAQDYNRFRERHSIQGPKLPEWLFLGYTILLLVTPWVPIPTPLPLVLIVWFFSVISSTCDAVNSVASTIPSGVARIAAGEIVTVPRAAVSP